MSERLLLLPGEKVCMRVSSMSGVREGKRMKGLSLSLGVAFWEVGAVSATVARQRVLGCGGLRRRLCCRFGGLER